MPIRTGKFPQVSQLARDGATLVGSPGIFGLSAGVTASSFSFPQVAATSPGSGFHSDIWRVFRALLIERNAIPLQRTFTPWRILFLLLVGPVAAMAVAVGISLAPGGEQYFHSTVAPGELPVVTWHLVPSMYVDRSAPPLDPIGTAVYQVRLDPIASAIEWVS